MQHQSRQNYLIRPLGIAAVILVLFCVSAASEPETDSWTFVSSPDFFNFDVPNPQPKWDDAVDYFLDSVKNENPDFFLVAGDLVNGHWWDSLEQLEHLANVYYGGWVRRMEDHGLSFYCCVGDHELGDDPWPPEKLTLVPHFKRAFASHMNIPDTGPEGFDGITYSVLHKNLLLVSVDTFEVRDGKMRHTVTGKQLEWLERILTENADVPHKVVMGHCPILPEVRARSSSRLMVEDGAESTLWQAMKNHGVDMYLCGEFHDITVKHVEGVWHLVHGASWGRVPDVNYLLVGVEPDKLHLTLKKIPLEFDGGAIWNINKGRGPREYVRISEEDQENGFQTVGTLTIDKSSGTPVNKVVTGIFNEGVSGE